MTRYEVGQRVRIFNPLLAEHGSTGVVMNYDFSLDWYVVDLDREHAPFRGNYMVAEMRKEEVEES